jgi:hypothetical protein
LEQVPNNVVRSFCGDRLVGPFIKRLGNRRAFEQGALLGAVAYGLMGFARRFHSLLSILTDIYLCHTCSCHEILRMETPGSLRLSWMPLGVRGCLLLLPLLLLFLFFCPSCMGTPRHHDHRPGNSALCCADRETFLVLRARVSGVQASKGPPVLRRDVSATIFPSGVPALHQGDDDQAGHQRDGCGEG